MDKKSYNHILQKSGVLRNFTVAKVVNKKELDELKRLIRTVASSEEEYKEILAEEMARMANMYDETNPIPGIIYPNGDEKFRNLAFNVTKKFCEGVRKHQMTVEQMAFLITAIINELGLTQEDFLKLKSQLEDEEDRDDEEDDDEGSS